MAGKKSWEDDEIPPPPPEEEEWTPSPPPEDEDEWIPSPPPEKEWMEQKEKITPSPVEFKSILDRMPRDILQHMVFPGLKAQDVGRYAQTAQGEQKSSATDLAKRKEALNAEKFILEETYDGEKQLEQLEMIFKMESNPYFDINSNLKKLFGSRKGISSIMYEADLTLDQWRRVLRNLESRGTIMEHHLTFVLEYSSLKPHEKQKLFDEFVPKLWMQYDDLGPNATGKLKLGSFLNVYKPYFYGKTWDKKKRQEIFSKWAKPKKVLPRFQIMPGKKIVWDPRGEYETMLTKYFGLESGTTP